MVVEANEIEERNTAVLEELEAAEEKVATILEVVAKAVEAISDASSVNTGTAERVNEAGQELLKLTNEVQECVTTHAHRTVDYKHYTKTSYEQAKRLDVLRSKVLLLQKEVERVEAVKEKDVEQSSDMVTGEG